MRPTQPQVQPRYILEEGLGSKCIEFFFVVLALITAWIVGFVLSFLRLVIGHDDVWACRFGRKLLELGSSDDVEGP